MQLLIIRHAIAEDKEAFANSGRPDSDRPLTKRGRKIMKRIAKGLHREVKSIDVLAASPFVRAEQTAAIVATEYGGILVETVPALEPERAPSALARWLRTQRDDDLVAIVGHEPHLGLLITWLVSGLTTPHAEIGKGGAYLLELGRAAGARSARVRWALTPDLLEKLSRK
jgi:phosphohistidine phosphatase